MSARKHRRDVARLVFWGNSGAAWYDLARNAGYEVDWNADRTEARLVWEGRVVGHMHRLPDPPEWFGFVFVPEARTPRLKNWLWTLHHPRTPYEAAVSVAPGADQLDEAPGA